MNLTFKRMLLPLGAGFLGALFLAGLYLGLVSVAQGPAHALELFWQDKAFVLPILLGFGVQVGLYTLLKTGLHLPPGVPAGATTAAGGGVSTVAMLACCAHHVAEALPLLGLTAVATFLAQWKIPFMVGGLLTNFAGIAVMLRVIFKERQRVLPQASTLTQEVNV